MIFYGTHAVVPIKINSEKNYTIPTSGKGRCFFVFFVSLVHLHRQNILKKHKIFNCLSKSANKPFTLPTPPLTSRVSGLQKNHVKYFATGIRSNYGYERPTQRIKNSSINLYDRFPPHS